MTCDIMIYSAEFAGDFFGKSGVSLSLREMEEGGIYNLGGTVTVTNSTFSGNSISGGVSSCGGIANEGALTVTNSTFSGNSATGGGIANERGVALTATNSTFSGNSARAVASTTTTSRWRSPTLSSPIAPRAAIASGLRVQRY